MPKLKRGNIVKITWEDANHLCGWKDLRDLSVEIYDYQRDYNESVGIFLYRDKQYTVIATSLSERMVSDTLVIPNTLVRKVKRYA